MLAQNLQDTEGETDFLVEQVLVQVESTKVLATGDPGNNSFRLEAFFRHDHGSALFRMLSVLDVDRNLSLNGRDQGFIVEDRETSIGQLPHLPISHRVNRLRIVNNLRVSRENSIDISKVFI